MVGTSGFPPQQLSFKQKGKNWRKQCVDWGADRTFYNYNPVRKSVLHKKINYDLLNGILHQKDIETIINPENLKSDFSNTKIQHYPIMNSKLNVLRGEEATRIFDFRLIVTNPLSISKIEMDKKAQILESLQEIIQSNSTGENQNIDNDLNKLNNYYNYEYQDIREIRGNAVLNHYIKEYNIPIMFNAGFMDALAVGEEIYRCSIVNDEPFIERLNPLKVRIFKSGYSNKIEDADMIVIEDYWSPGKIIDTFFDGVGDKSALIKYLEKADDTLNASTDSMGNIDERQGFINSAYIGDNLDHQYTAEELFGESNIDVLTPYDVAGNIRVVQVYWKSRRKVKKVKSFDPVTGDEKYSFYPETYVINDDLGESEETLWINEAWEGTKIGDNVYMNMRPMPVQYNRLSNPSRCHFGIVGSIYNLNESKPFSMVDMMKRYNYMYDVIHDRLNKLMARNWGKIITMDFAKIPKGWNVDKWMYYAKTAGIAVIDSFKEGSIGASTGKLSGALNNASSGVIDAEMGNSIQSQIALLEFIKNEMAEVVGITRQREGQISNRETVGGVERATLQSSHITEWLFAIHDDVKKRALECLLETAKIALSSKKNMKFQYVLSDSSIKLMDIDGDEFAESDYGLVVDYSSKTQELNQKLDVLAQAALQTQTLSFSTIMKLYSSMSISEKQRLVELDEQQIKEQQNQAIQQQQQLQQQQIQSELQQKQAEMQLKDQMNQRDNETKIAVANIESQASIDKAAASANNDYSDKKLDEQARQFNERLDLDKKKLEFAKADAKEKNNISREKANKSNTNR